MTNAGFWKQVNSIINGGFTSEGLQILDYYAELFINGRFEYKRFSPFEQHGCAAGGAKHVVATLIAAAKNATDKGIAPYGDNFKGEVECGACQTANIEQKARQTGCWPDCVDRALTLSLGAYLCAKTQTRRREDSLDQHRNKELTESKKMRIFATN